LAAINAVKLSKETDARKLKGAVWIAWMLTKLKRDRVPTKGSSAEFWRISRRKLIARIVITGMAYVIHV
jgi:hypothetical protein